VVLDRHAATNVLTATPQCPRRPSGDFANLTISRAGHCRFQQQHHVELDGARQPDSTIIAPLRSLTPGPAQCSGGVQHSPAFKRVPSSNLQGVLTNTGTILAPRSTSSTPRQPLPTRWKAPFIRALQRVLSFRMVLKRQLDTTSGSPLASAGFGAGVMPTINLGNRLIDFGF